MLIPLDVFAEMLEVSPNELLLATHSRGEIDGIQLPTPHAQPGAVMMFDEAEATAFSHLWHERVQLQPDVPDGVSMTLCAFAELAGIAPLALYQAVTSGRRVKGVRPPAPTATGIQLMFEPAAVSRFVGAYRSVMKKNR